MILTIGAINHAVFATAFILYTLIVVGVGVYAARFARRSDEDYFLAGRSLGKWVAGLSASASSESGWVTLGLVGMGFRYGMQAYWIVPGCLFGVAFIWFVLAGRLRDRAGALGALTLPDFFAQHFGERRPLVRSLSVVVILVAMMLYVAAQFAAAGKAFEASFPKHFDYTTGVFIGALIVLVYTVSGGFRAVCWTDFLQAILMLIALVVFPVFLLWQHGGFAGLRAKVAGADPADFAYIDAASSFVTTEKLFSMDPEKSGLALFGFILGAGALGINFGYPGQPHVLARFMALKDRREAVGGGLIAVTWVGLVLWGAVTVGLAVKALSLGGAAWGEVLLGEAGATGAAVSAASEKALVLGAMNLLPAAVAGAVLAAVLAAICSTADSQLVVAASAAANDVYVRLLAKDKSANHVLFDRIVVFVIGLAAVLLVMSREVTVYRYVLTYGWAILGAAFGPQVILILLWRRASYAGCLAGMAVGFLVPLLWQAAYDVDATGVEIYNLPLGFICAMMANVLVSLAPTRGRRARAPGSRP